MSGQMSTVDPQWTHGLSSLTRAYFYIATFANKKNCLRTVPVTVTRRSALCPPPPCSTRSGFVLCAGFSVGLSLSAYVNVTKKHILLAGYAAVQHFTLAGCQVVIGLQVGDELS
jgi:hypothetical protein